MGQGLAWKGCLIQNPGIAVLINAVNQNEIPGHIIENQNVGPAPAPGPGPVYENCALIRNQTLSVPPELRKSRESILRLLDTCNDFGFDICRIVKIKTEIIQQQTRRLRLGEDNNSRSDNIDTDDAVEEGMDALTFTEVQLRENKQILEESLDLERKCTENLFPRFDKYKQNCNYHIKSIQRLLRMELRGDLDVNTISPMKLDFLWNHVYPALKDSLIRAKKYLGMLEDVIALMSQVISMTIIGED